jgi:ribosome-binding factor A
VPACGRSELCGRSSPCPERLQSALLACYRCAVTRRSERVSDLLLETLAEILLREVKDPRIGSVTLTGIEVTDDLRHARVRYSTLGDAAARVRAQKGLESASRFMQGKAARLLRMRYTPEIRFEYDEGFERADELNRLLQQVRTPPSEDGSE